MAVILRETRPAVRASCWRGFRHRKIQRDATGENRGRVVKFIERGEPALMLAHWTGIYWNGQELGCKIFQEVVRRLHARFDHLHWMKLSEVARYWAAKDITRIELQGTRIAFRAPFACPDFTVRFKAPENSAPEFRAAGNAVPLKEVSNPLQLQPGTWPREREAITVWFALPRAESSLEMKL